MKKLLALVLALALVIGLCPAMADTGVDCKGTGIELTIYTNSGSDGREDWLKARAAEDGYKLVTVSDGAAAIQERLKGEKANPIADVVFGLNAIIWNDLIAEDVLVPYEAPSWTDEVDPALNDPNGYYYAIVIQAILLAYDSNQLAEDEAPTDWTDLWENEAFWGKYESQIKLTGGTTRNVLAGILCRYADPDGELGISDEGWAAIEAFFAHGTPVEDGVNLYAQMVNPDSPVVMGQMWSSGVLQYDAEYGTKTAVVVPECGIPYAVEGVGIVNKEQDEAKMAEIRNFIEWFGSAEIQGEWCEEFGSMPANAKAAEKADPRQVELCSIPAQDIDWALVAANIGAWCEHITLYYMQ